MNIETDRALLPPDVECTRYLLVRVEAPKRPAQPAQVDGSLTPARRPLHVAFALDRSGSMAGEKIALAKVAIARAIELLGPEDEFSIVTFSDEAETVVRHKIATPDAKAKAMARLNAVEAGQSTNLAAGWARAADYLKRATETPASERRRIGSVAARELRDVTPAGWHRDDDDRAGRRLRRSADVANGHRRRRALLLHRVRTSDSGSALAGTRRSPRRRRAPRAALCEVMAVRTRALNGFAQTARGFLHTVLLGDLVAGQNITVILEVKCEPGDSLLRKPQISCDVGLADDDHVFVRRFMQVKWLCVDQATHDAQFVNVDMLAEVAAEIAANAKADALVANRANDFRSVRRILRSAATKIRGLMAGDASLERIAIELEGELEPLQHHLEALAAKRRHFENYTLLQNRDSRGLSRRASNW